MGRVLGGRITSDAGGRASETSAFGSGGQRLKRSEQDAQVPVDLVLQSLECEGGDVEGTHQIAMADYLRGQEIVSDGDVALWVTFWLAGAALCIALFIWTGKFREIPGSHVRVRPLILLGVIPCGGLFVIPGLVAFAVFMAMAIPARQNALMLGRPQTRYPTAGPGGRPRLSQDLLPPGTTDRIVAFGQNSFFHNPKYRDWELEPDMYQLAQANRDRFLDEIVGLSLRGGWLALGAERLVVSVVGGDLPDARYGQLMEAACQFLRSIGATQFQITGYESSYWAARQPWEPWGGGSGA